MEQHLDCNVSVENVTPKLNRAIGILSKIRDYAPKFWLKTIHYSLFNSYLIYACQVWVQNKKYLAQLSTLQNKAIRIINLTQHNHLYQYFLNILNDLLTYIIIQHDKQPITLPKFIAWIPSLTNAIQPEINQLLHGILL